MLRKILIVDDYEMNLQILRKILQDDYEVIAAKNGKEALNIIIERHDELSAVLLDVVMPVMDGYELLKTIRGDAQLQRLPVIVTTGSEEAGGEETALSKGANDFVIKPYVPKIIKRRLANLIALSEAAAEARASRLDALTGLYSHAAFYAKAAEMIAAKKPGYYVMASFDINGFKVINDQYGTETGNKLLVFLANTFRDGFEPAGGICCRVFADHFAVLYPKSFMKSKKIAEMRRIAQASDPSLPPIIFSVGRYIVDDVSLAPSAMYDRATLAAETVKGRVDEHIAVFDEKMRARLLREQAITAEMLEALQTNQFEVMYEPRYNHVTGALIGAKANARWKSPVLGVVPIEEFAPIFIKNGFIFELNKYIIEQVCIGIKKQLKAKRKPLPIAVNLSSVGLQRDDLDEILTGFLKKYDIPIDLLHFSISESIFDGSVDLIINSVNKLLSLGFIVELNDFGSGSSSYYILKNVQAQVLKINLHMLEGGDNLTRSGNLLESIARMAKWLGMTVVVSGIDSPEQADFLKTIGCNYVQGKLYSPLLTSREFYKLVTNEKNEEHPISLVTADNLNNNTFWESKSMDTLIFNSYVGSACIFEFSRGRVELLRANDKYRKMLSDAGIDIDTAMKMDWASFLSDESKEKLELAFEQSLATNADVTDEFAFTGIPGVSGTIYLRSSLRVIASAGNRYLVYCFAEDITEWLEAKIKKDRAVEQLYAITDNINSGITASTVNGNNITFFFATNRYYEILGYTKQQYDAEVSSTHLLIHEEDRQIVMDKANECYRTGKPTTMTYRAVKRDGSVIWLGAVLSLHKFKDIDMPVQLSVFRDITYEIESARKLSEADEQLRFLNDAAKDLLATESTPTCIDNVLNKLMNYFGADRSFILECDFDKGTFTDSYEVTNGKSVSMIDNVQDLPLSLAWYWLETFKTSNFIYINSSDDFGDGRAVEKDMYASIGVKSTLAVALRIGGKLIGSMGVSNPTKHLEDYENLVALGDYMSVILARRDLNNKIISDSNMLRTLMDDTPGGFMRLRVYPNRAVKIVFTNSGLCSLLGLSKREVMEAFGQHILNGIHPEDHQLVRDTFDTMLKSGEFRTKCRLRYGKDDYLWVLIFGRLVKTDDDEMYLNCYCSDLSEEEKRVRSFQETLPFVLSAIMESTEDVAFAKDHEFRYVCCSNAFAKYAGVSSVAEIVGKTDFELFDDEAANRFREEDLQIMQDGKPIVNTIAPYVSPDGVLHYSTTSKHLLRDTIGNAIGIYGTSRDITEYRAAYEQLQLLNDNLPGGIAKYEVSPSGVKLTYFNENFAAASGYTKPEFMLLMDRDPTCLVASEDRLRAYAAIRSFKRGHPRAECTYRYRVKDGSMRWFNMKGMLSEIRGDTLIINAVRFDITDQKLAEEARRIHEEELMVAMSQMGKMICEFDITNRTLTLPEEYANWYDLPITIFNAPESVINFGLLEEKTDNDFIAFYRKMIDGEREGSFDLHIRRKDGSWHWESLNFVTIFNDIGSPVKAIISIDDVTVQEEIKHRYEHEIQLRHELIRDSSVYYEINLSTGIIEEFRSQFNDVPGMKSATPTNSRIRKAILKNIFPKDREAFENAMLLPALLRAFEDGKTTSEIEYRRFIPSGNVCWFKANANIMLKPNTDEIVAFVYIHNIDISYKNRLALNNIIDEEIESVAILHLPSGLGRYVNSLPDRSGMMLNTEFDFNEHIEQTTEKFVYEDDKVLFREFFNMSTLAELLDSRPSSTVTYRVINSEGDILRKRTLAFFLDETHEDIVISRRDITGLYEEEQRQRQFLEMAVDAANDANRAKSDFLSRMSHDMRTPMNAVIGMVNLAKEQDNPPQTAEYLSNIDSSSHFLLGLINDVLDLSRIESGRIELHEEILSYDEFSRSIQTVIEPSMAAKHIDFVCSFNCGESDIIVDKLRFNQIFFNLLSNAAKYTAEYGRVEFISTPIPDRDGKRGMRFIVRDNGIGMSEDFLKIIFEPFSQERNNRNASAQGSGLGLAIVKNLVDAMGGSISVNSTPGEGSEFVVDLYLTVNTSENKADAAEAVSDECFRDLRILLVEDNEMNVIVAQKLLERKGCIIEVASDGLEALNTFEASAVGYYKIILMDIRMPVMDGIEATKKIRALSREDAKTVPIIAMTADAFTDDRARTLDAGMNAHITKPIEPDLLYETIGRSL